jgi:tRNA threonylcarbamoyladenosine biosynthesis protein TsaE
VAIFISNSPGDTEKFGRDFAGKVEPGTVIGLKGELGTGKTQLVKGLAAGLGCTSEVTSPTFTIIHEYAGCRLPVYHLDFFRIDNRASAEQLGLEDFLFGEGVCVIEWADKFPELIPEHAIWIVFEATSEQQRRITYQGAAASTCPPWRKPPFTVDGPAAAGETGVP